MRKSSQKHEKTKFRGSAKLTRSRQPLKAIMTRSRHLDTRSGQPLQAIMTRSGHLDTRSCHLTIIAKCIFTFSRIKSRFWIQFQLCFRQCIP